MRIIYTRPDGGLSIVSPAPGVEIERILAKDIPTDAIGVKVVDESVIPADRTFRGAWEDSVGVVVVNMTKAKLLHMARIRQARDAKLAELDTESLLAIESDDKLKQKQITDLKQVLRDIPQTLDLGQAQTPEQLKALWPAEL